ncbi:PIN domain-containing protein [Lewinella sp. JB7]|uniref:PIN domain-containing protein n=1 Tax=Lewinella sp. JB7 TaxID=2962887 RepID=UPI0020CA14EE|nr:PIN domain-containing protein [Lewinella sp. JB7]MCP9236853.1 PIN domain-containing protein [Lewinella sp. JB7]
MTLTTTLEAEVIFLDSSFVIKEKYLQSPKFIKLAELAKDNNFSIKLVSLVVDEVLHRAHREITDVLELRKRRTQAFSSKVKVLPASPLLDTLQQDNELDVPAYLKEIRDEFSRLFDKYDIECVEVSKSSVDMVFDRYFKGQRPFGIGRKKHQFPDAFILETILADCRKRKGKAYLLTTDPDLLGVREDMVIPTMDLDSLINLADKVAQAVLDPEKVAAAFGKHHEEVEEQIIKSFSPEILSYTVSAFSHDKKFTGTDVFLPEIKNIHLERATVSKITDGVARVYVDRAVIQYYLPTEVHEDRNTRDYELGNYGGTVRKEKYPGDIKSHSGANNFEVGVWLEFNYDVHSSEISIIDDRFNLLYMNIINYDGSTTPVSI